MDIKQEVETQFARLRLADVTVPLGALRSPPVCSGRPLSLLARDSIVTGSTFATACGRPVGTAAALPSRRSAASPVHAFVGQPDQGLGASRGP